MATVAQLPVIRAIVVWKLTRSFPNFLNSFLYIIPLLFHCLRAGSNPSSASLKMDAVMDKFHVENDSVLADSALPQKLIIDTDPGIGELFFSLFSILIFRDSIWRLIMIMRGWKIKILLRTSHVLIFLFLKKISIGYFGPFRWRLVL